MVGPVAQGFGGRLDAQQQIGFDQLPPRRVHGARHGGLVHAQMLRNILQGGAGHTLHSAILLQPVS